LIEGRKEEATGRIRQGIRRLNLSHGNATGYHETISLAWVAVIARFLADHDSLEDSVRKGGFVGEVLESLRMDKVNLLNRRSSFRDLGNAVPEVPAFGDAVGNRR
jgi:hypothetical protein